MAAPEIYKDKLIELRSKEIDFHPTTAEAAQKSIVKIEKRQLFLEALNKQLTLETKRVEKKYRQAKKAAGITLLDTLFKVGTSNKNRKMLDEKRQQLLTDYAEANEMSNRISNFYQTKKEQLIDFLGQELGQKPKRLTSTLGGLLPKNSSQPRHRTPNYQAYLRSPSWKKKAEAAKIRAGNRCQLCNKSRNEVQLEAHHRTYERLGNELPGDITVLCRDCHESHEIAKAKRTLAEKTQKPSRGVCIRCREKIRLNQKKPLCVNCYKAWTKTRDFAVTENYCHVCGKRHASSMARPACLDCYKEIKLNRHA